MGAPRIALVVKGYPRLSETFIAQEIHGLEERNLDLLIVSLRHPTEPTVHPVHRAIRAPVLYLPEYLHHDPIRVLKAWAKVRARTGFRPALDLWWRDLRRDRTRNRMRRFGQALVLAAELPPSIELLYVHYLHTPASVTRYASAIIGLPFAISAHAKDIWTIPPWEKREKLRDGLWLTTCTRTNAAHLRKLAPDAEVFLTYHGLDVSRFSDPGRRLGGSGADPAQPIRILTVARRVPKKGLDILLDALAGLPAGIHWVFEHIGGGELGADLKQRAASLGLADRIVWHGAKPADDVLEAYRRADLFVLPSRIAPDGDRDGLPNVLLEAGAMTLPIVASEVAAIPEFIRDRENGILVPSGDPDALATAMAGLIRDPARRLQLGRAARETVLAGFAAKPGLDRLAMRLRSGLSPLRDAA